MEHIEMPALQQYITLQVAKCWHPRSQQVAAPQKLFQIQI